MCGGSIQTTLPAVIRPEAHKLVTCRPSLNPTLVNTVGTAEPSCGVSDSTVASKILGCSSEGNTVTIAATGRPNFPRSPSVSRATFGGRANTSAPRARTVAPRRVVTFITLIATGPTTIRPICEHSVRPAISSIIGARRVGIEMRSPRDVACPLKQSRNWRGLLKRSVPYSLMANALGLIGLSISCATYRHSSGRFG